MKLKTVTRETHLQLRAVRCWSSAPPHEERVGRGPRRGAVRKTNLLSPALSSIRWRRGRSLCVALIRRCAEITWLTAGGRRPGRGDPPEIEPGGDDQLPWH